MLYKEDGRGAIIGVHTGGNGMRNYGTVFYDFEGLAHLYEGTEFAKFMDLC